MHSFIHGTAVKLLRLYTETAPAAVEMTAGEFPNENDWIRVTGHPELVTEGYYTNLYLNVASLEVKAERGTEFVTQ